MKKYLFTLVAALVSATLRYAQNTLVATLSHQDCLTMFYGSSALVSAVEAAESGDIITLSAGQFAFADIDKGITIRGEGAGKTVIGQGTSSTKYQILIPENDANRLCMEGLTIDTYYGAGSKTVYIYGNTSNLYFIKCVISNNPISFGSSSSVNATFVDCNIKGLALNGSSYTKFSNCIVSRFSNVSGTTSKADFFNCIIYAEDSYPSNKYYRASFVNSFLFYNTLYSGTLPSETVAMNSMFIQGHFNGVNGAIDCLSLKQSDVKDIFINYSSYTDQYGIVHYTPVLNSQLTDEAKTLYLGTDGKEVGIYGGQYPYDLTPSYPIITKMNVAKQATADNKLSVEIEVSAVE
ncbi:MAG: hypothetical protein J5545_09545 [Bacteroidaceae bacterium]|nr:hypothetical protein [Bacteroidaceae bacterium]